MKALKLITFLSIFLIVSCGSKKSVATVEELKVLESIVQSKAYEIDSDMAYPQVTNAVQQVFNSGLMQPGNTPGNINLIGNPNYLRIHNDSVYSYLPYFGERQMRGGYDAGDGAIELKSLMKDYQVNQKKDGSYRISFTAEGNQESFQVYINIFPSLKSTMSVNGVYRFPIQYSGMVKPKEDKDL
ncbi:DUF4251 domain-containing protein [Aestuariivivens sediminicola]|uniref:DUF4251 domain-containing protein n=1 Tax=Aestuariivivens sediminicola TaxID=2913560 RepID=UPI001F58AD3F|nr:DUF4251 domain-containing protein [Aestuariivivens sediminicola]